MRATQEEWPWIFALAISEGVRWSVAQVNPGSHPAIRTRTVPFANIHSEYLLNDQEIAQPHDLQSRIRDRLEQLSVSPTTRDIFKRVKAVGAASYGIVNRNDLTVSWVGRRNWRSEPVFDFGALFGSLFPMVDQEEKRIRVNNDTTAMALAEALCAREAPGNLYYALFGLGVNCGIIAGSKEIEMWLHPEVGHLLPVLHPRDLGFNPAHSGCVAHTYCYEGMASMARIQKQWGAPLCALRNHPDNPWDIIAYYIASMCWTGALHVTPNRIVLGGPIVFEGLVPLIKRHFRHLNEANAPRASRRPLFPFGDREFIQLACLDHNHAELLGALEMARFACFSRPTAATELR